MSYVEQRSWSDSYIDKIKVKIAPFVIGVADIVMDTQYATDFTVVFRTVHRNRELRIAVRMRKPGYASRFPNDFTIRSRLANGWPTEFDKIMRGFGDWFFYGFATSKAEIDPWYLIDLDTFRLHHHLADKGEIPNVDGRTFLRAYDIRRFPSTPPILIGSSFTAKPDIHLTFKPLARNVDRIQLDLFGGKH